MGLSPILYPSYLHSSYPNTSPTLLRCLYPHPRTGNYRDMIGSWSRRLRQLVVLLSLIGGAYADDGSIGETARITLACLLGGVPAVSILMMLTFCLYIRKRKAEIRQHAIANGIELDEEGWPVHLSQRYPSRPSSAPTSHINSLSRYHFSDRQARHDSGAGYRDTSVRQYSDELAKGPLSIHPARHFREVMPTSVTLPASQPMERNTLYPSTATAY